MSTVLPGMTSVSSGSAPARTALAQSSVSQARVQGDRGVVLARRAPRAPDAAGRPRARRCPPPTRRHPEPTPTCRRPPRSPVTGCHPHHLLHMSHLRWTPPRQHAGSAVARIGPDYSDGAGGLVCVHHGVADRREQRSDGPRSGRRRGVRSDDRHRAAGLVHQRVADRAEDQPGELAVTSGSDDDELRVPATAPAADAPGGRAHQSG